MISSPSPPPAPNPQATAAAQTASNQATAQYQTSLNNVNQVTPQGNLTYTYENTGPGGAPQATATQTLSPQEQALFDLGNQTQQNIGNIGVSQSAKIGSLLDTPLDLSPSAVDSHLTDLGNARLQPLLNQQWQKQESDLMNRGIMPGSEAYQLAQDANNRQRNDAYNQLVLGGYGQGVQDLLTQRNQPINEISALLSGSQVSQPNFVGNGNTVVAPTDVAGITNNAYQGQLASYGIQQQGQNALLGGLAGLGGAALGGWASGGLSSLPRGFTSDRRAKKNIKKVGVLDNGLPVYSFEYKWGGPTQIGLMADEVEKIHPAAVETVGGLKRVDYEMAVT